MSHMHSCLLPLQDFQIILEKEGASGKAAACTTVLPGKWLPAP